MERIWHHNKPAKRGPSTKTQGPGKVGINQRGHKETKDNPEGAAKLHRGDGSTCPYVHFKPYTPQSWALRKSGQNFGGFLAIKEHTMSDTNPTPLITQRTLSPQ
jgi:hypothetical protein